MNGYTRAPAENNLFNKAFIYIFRYLMSLGFVTTLPSFHFPWQNGHTALMVASYEGHTAIIQILLRAGAEIDTKDTVSVYTTISVTKTATCVENTWKCALSCAFSSFISILLPPPTTTSLLWTSQVLALYFTLLLSCNILFWFRCGSGWWMHSLPPCCWLRWFCHYGSPSGSRGWQGRQGWGQALLCIVV
jgi:hypothetical protein